VSGTRRSRRSQVRRVGYRPCSVSKARNCRISGVGWSSTVSSVCTLDSRRTIMITNAFKNKRSE
jgi:hypothetical protein